MTTLYFLQTKRHISTVAFEIANSQFDKQILVEEKFRDFRKQLESSSDF
jgi:hypothetical protein